jgi:hypothetical protein
MHTEVSASGVSDLYITQLQINPEEPILETTFGQAFLDYKSSRALDLGGGDDHAGALVEF